MSKTTDYSDLTNEELIKELKSRDSEQVSIKQTFESLKVLEMIQMAQTDFITIDSETNIFHQMLDHFLEVTKSEYGFIDEMFYTDDGKPYLEARSITNIAWDDESRGLHEKMMSGDIKFDNLNSLFGQVLTTGKPFFTNKALGHPKSCGIPEGHPALDAFLGIPLYAGKEFVGVIGLANAAEGFSEEMIQLLEPLTKICGIIMNSFKIDQGRMKAQEELTNNAKELAVKVKELEKMNDLMVNRELKMTKLKEEIEALKNK